MIQLTRLNQKPLMVNSDLLKFVENTPDTVITLVSGEKIVVLESIDAIVEKIIEFRRRLLDGLTFNGINSPQVLSHVQRESAHRDKTGHAERHEEYPESHHG